MTKTKYIHSWDTLRNSSDIYRRVNNEKQDCKTGTVCLVVLVGGEGEWKRCT
jgi:hypothetical protein